VTLGTDCPVRVVVPLGGYSVAEGSPPDRALGGLDLESFFVTPNRTGWTVAKDGVHVLGQGNFFSFKSDNHLI